MSPRIYCRVRYYWDSDSCPCSLHRQVSPFTSCYLPIVPSSTTWYATASLYPPSSACCVISRLRHFSASSPPYPAETGSSSYGPTVRLRLLPTPPRDDAVTFSFRERASPGKGLAPLGPRLVPGALAPPSTAARRHRPTLSRIEHATMEGGATNAIGRIFNCSALPKELTRRDILAPWLALPLEGTVSLTQEWKR